MEKEEITKEVGMRICAKRKALGMSQEELAHLSGFKSRASINRIELGIQDVRRSKLIEIAKALNTTPAYIMGWEKDEEEAIRLENNEIIMAYATRLMKLDENKRKAIFNLIDSLDSENK